MARKMNGELKFQLKIANRLYIGELVNCLQVNGLPEFANGSFSTLMIGDGKVFMRIFNNVILPPDLDNKSFDIYQHEEITIGAGYRKAKRCGEVNMGSDKKKKICVKFKTKNDDYAWVREKYLDYFSDCQVWIKDEHSPILILSKIVSTVEGLIYPYVVKK